MRAVADLVFGEIGLPGIDYVMIAGKFLRDAKADELTKDTFRATGFLNDKILRSESKCKS
jgi:hypothetical protein